MIITNENWTTVGKTSSIAALSTLAELESKTGLGGDRPKTNYLNHDTPAILLLYYLHSLFMPLESYLQQSTAVFSLVIFIYSRVFLIYGLFNPVVSGLVQIT